MDGTSLAAGALKLIMLCNTLICCRWKISLLQGTLKVFGAEFPGVKILVAPKKISGTVMINSSLSPSIVVGAWVVLPGHADLAQPGIIRINQL